MPTVEAMELTGKIRFIWLKHTLDLIDKGQVKKVISRLKRWQGKGQQRVLNLAKYLERFRDALHYEKYRSLVYRLGQEKLRALIATFPKNV
jgi:hypothetical protein